MVAHYEKAIVPAESVWNRTVDYGLDTAEETWFDFMQKQKISLFFQEFRQTKWPNKYYIEWVLAGVLSLWDKAAVAWIHIGLTLRQAI